jgi:hypothetical protein
MAHYKASLGSVDRERAAMTGRTRALAAFISTGLVFMLVPGTLLGVWTLLQIGARRGASLVSPAWLQAHGHAQVFGWIGTFILGIGLYSIPSAAVPATRLLRRTWFCWGLWTSGAATRWAAGAYGWQWRLLLPVSAVLELSAFLVFLSLVSKHRPSTGRVDVWIRLVLVATAGMAATLVMNLGLAIDAAWRGDGPAIAHGIDQRFLVLAAWGFLAPFVWGFSARWLPIFLGLRPSRSRWLAAAIVFNTTGVLLALANVIGAAMPFLFAGAVSATVGLRLFESTMAPPKTRGVHPSFPVFVRLAFGWMVVGAAFGIAAARWDTSGGLWGASRHAFTVGFIAMMVFVIGPRVLPAFVGVRALWSPRLMFGSLALLTVGCLLRVGSEAVAYQTDASVAWSLLPISGFIELTAIVLFALNLGVTVLLGDGPTTADASQVAAAMLVSCAMLGWPARADSQTPSAPAGHWQYQVRDTTRAEAWRFFDPPPGGGQPDYTFPENRLFASLTFINAKVEVIGGLQYVAMAQLPTQSKGPGLLGSGAQYFDLSGRRDSQELYARRLEVRLKGIAPGLTIDVGRQGYTSGAEAASGNTDIEAVKRLRLDSRLIGEFEWSMYQRAFDGARVDLDRRDWHASGAWFEPTQGGFERDAGARLTHVGVAALTFDVKPKVLRHFDWQTFAYRYDDTRAVTGRPDNTGLTATSANVHLTSIGSSLVGAIPIGTGRVDTFTWLVWQRGRWYGQQDAANAEAFEAGYQWTHAAGTPWLRLCWFRSSGDDNPSDDRHTTFFQMLPTARRFSLSTLYNLMNSREVFGQAIVRPRKALTVRAELHKLSLTSAADLWYGGSGASVTSGASFGFAGRKSNGATDLGTIVEGAADWTIARHLSVNAYLARMNGGAVVTGSFASRRLTFAYLESVLTF